MEQNIENIRERLEREHGKIWDAAQFEAEFEVLCWLMYPCLVVRRLKDGVEGGLFVYSQCFPRLYYGFEPDES